VPRHVARLVMWLVTPLVVDHSASRRLVIDYFASAARPGAAARPVARRQLLRLAQAHRRLLRLRRASRCLGTSRCSSRRSSSTSPPRAGSSSTTPPHAGSSSTTPPCAGSPSTTLPTPRVRVPRHVARPVTRLIADYSVHRGFVLWPRWLYFSHTVHGDYLSRGNTGSTSSTTRAATTSSSGRIASTIHLD
jgi:hypothetical protein